MTVMVTAFNGATLSAPTDLVSDTDGSTAGTCDLQDPTHIVCTFTTSGSSDHAKGVLFSYTLTVPASAPAGSTVATQTWSDSVQTGNLTGDDVYTFVTTGPSSPTSPGQCKSEAWMNYGPMFKNQGDCVSYVNRLATG